ncbi:ATP-binding protein [uncultured Microscilla sp.]|uniref:ATP-binding protein n=1 Tax=uncultured Microscilla sp. TaxID=432653 RepID=UPI002629EAF1|nr:ATP-binding protein [uncultured Microscilla sp.]
MGKKIIFILWVFILGAGHLLAQKNCDKINELNTKLLVLPEDSSKVNVLNTLAHEHLAIDQDIALEYANTAYQLAKKINYTIGQGKALINIGKQHYRKENDFESTLEYYQKALQLFQEANSLEHITEAYEAIGKHYHDLYYLNKEKYYEEALKNYEQAMLAYQKWKPRRQMDDNEKEYLAKLYQRLAELYTVTENDTEALRYSKKSIRIKKQLEKYQNNFEFQFINQRIARLNNTLKKEHMFKIGLFVAIGLLLVFALLLLINSGQKQKVNKRLKQQTRDLANQNRQIEEQNKKIIRQNKEIELSNFELTESSKKEKEQKEAIAKVNEELTRKNEEVLAQRKLVLESNKELNKKNQEIQFQYEQLERANKKFLHANEMLNTILDEIEKKNTDLEAQRDDLSNAKNELEKLQKSKARLTAMVAHDLRNPLNVVVGYSNPDSNIVIDGDTKKHIYKASQRINSLIDDMLDVQKYANSQIQIEKSQLTLCDTAQEAINELSIFAQQKGVQIQNKIGAQWQSTYDGKYIRRVFENLLTNAIKFTPNGGTIIFEAKENLKNEQLIVSVTDTGEGIPAHKFKEIFEPFNQLDARNFANTSSTGLGLTFCKMAIEAHQSHIKVRSKVGEGTSFFFELPKIEVEATAESLTSQNTTDTHNTLSFSEEDKAFLAPYIQQLKKYELYEISDLEKVLEQILVVDRPDLKQWKMLIKAAIDNYNEAEFDRLIIAAEGNNLA